MHYFDHYGWYTTQPIAGRAAETVPANTSETTTPGQLRANWTGHAWVDLPYEVPPASPSPVVMVPHEVTRRQARQALLLAGLLDSVQPAIDAIPDATQRRLVQIEWEDSQTFQRDRPVLLQLAAALGLTSEQLDALFVSAATL